MDSHAAVAYSSFLVVDCVVGGKGENLGELLLVEETRFCFSWGGGGSCGMLEQGHASPRETPLMAVRDEGQMGAKPDIKTFHRTGRMTMGLDVAWVVGWSRR